MNEEKQSLPTAEANVFATSPGGYKVHFKLTFPEASGVMVGVKNLNTLIEGMANAGFMPDTAMSSSGGAPRGGQDPAPACPECGGEVYDNRGNKRNPKGPDFKCKSKQCGLVGWLSSNENVEGGVEWQWPRV